MNPLDTKAIRAVAITGTPGEWLVAAPSLLLTLCDDLDEARATLANERGEGLPPSPMWTWADCGGWGWAWVFGIGSPNAWIAVGRKPASGWYIRLGADFMDLHKQVSVTYPTAREAMRAAMTAADKTQSPA